MRKYLRHLPLFPCLLEREASSSGSNDLLGGSETGEFMSYLGIRRFLTWGAFSHCQPLDKEVHCCCQELKQLFHCEGGLFPCDGDFC
jgi:hypothetical protein